MKTSRALLFSVTLVSFFLLASSSSSKNTDWWESGKAVFSFVGPSLTPLKFVSSTDNSAAAIVGSLSSGALLPSPATPAYVLHQFSTFVSQIEKDVEPLILNSTVSSAEDYVLPTDLIPKDDSSFLLTGHFKSPGISSTSIKSDGIASNVFQVELDDSNAIKNPKKLTNCAFSSSFNQRANAVSGSFETASSVSVSFYPGFGTCSAPSSSVTVESPSPVEAISKSGLITVSARALDESSLVIEFLFGTKYAKNVELDLETGKDSSLFHVKGISTGLIGDVVVALITGTVPVKSNITIKTTGKTSTISPPSDSSPSQCSWYIAVSAPNEEEDASVPKVISKVIVCNSTISSSVFSTVSNSFWISSHFSSSSDSPSFDGKTCSTTSNKKQIGLIEMVFSSSSGGSLKTNKLSCSKTTTDLTSGPLVERKDDKKIQIAAVSLSQSVQTLTIFDLPVSTGSPASPNPVPSTNPKPTPSRTPKPSPNPKPDSPVSSASSASPESPASPATSGSPQEASNSKGGLESSDPDEEATGTSFLTKVLFVGILGAIGLAVAGFFYYKKKQEPKIQISFEDDGSALDQFPDLDHDGGRPSNQGTV